MSVLQPPTVVQRWVPLLLLTHVCVNAGLTSAKQDRLVQCCAVPQLAGGPKVGCWHEGIGVTYWHFRQVLPNELGEQASAVTPQPELQRWVPLLLLCQLWGSGSPTSCVQPAAAQREGKRQFAGSILECVQAGLHMVQAELEHLKFSLQLWQPASLQ